MSAHKARWCWLALAASGFATALVLAAASANPLLPGIGLLVAMSAGFLHQRAARLETEQRLHEREALIRIVVDGAIDAIVTVDPLGEVVSFNRAAERMFGWPSADIVGRSVNLLFAPAPEGEGTSGGNPLRDGERETLARRRDGSWFPMHLKCSGSQIHPRAVVTAIVRDLTQYRHTAEALQVANALLETKVVELEERTRVITLLGQMSDHLQAAVSPEDAYASVADYARELFPLDAGALCALGPSKDTVEVVASWGEPAVQAGFAPEDCLALSSGRVHTVRGEDLGRLCLHVSSHSAAGHACIPITSQGEPVGVAYFGWHCDDAGADEAASGSAPFRLKLAVAFAEQVGLGLTNLRLKEILREQAIHDPLTGLHNRRFLEEAIHRELLRAARRGSPVGFLMLDLDNFKAFNDAHGHAAGDALLRAFATQLRSDIRAEDIACRYGGEEFAVILPDATPGEASTRAEQIREGVQKIVVDFQGKRLPGVSVSIGVAAFPEHGHSADGLQRAADAALYAAKAEGRNRTKLAVCSAKTDAEQPSFGLRSPERPGSRLSS